MRLIDADALIGELHTQFFYDGRDRTRVYAKIQEQPTADVVEVVRCKDCIHGIPTRIDTVTREFSDERYCNRHHMCHFEDYYCADGERKETEDE